MYTNVGKLWCEGEEVLGYGVGSVLGGFWESREGGWMNKHHVYAGRVVVD